MRGRYDESIAPFESRSGVTSVARTDRPRIRPLRANVLELNTATGAEALADLFDAAEKTGVVFQPVREPFVFTGEAGLKLRRAFRDA